MEAFRTSEDYTTGWGARQIEAHARLAVYYQRYLLRSTGL